MPYFTGSEEITHISMADKLDICKKAPRVLGVMFGAAAARWFEEEKHRESEETPIVVVGTFRKKQFFMLAIAYAAKARLKVRLMQDEDDVYTIALCSADFYQAIDEEAECDFAKLLYSNIEEFKATYVSCSSVYGNVEQAKYLCERYSDEGICSFEKMLAAYYTFALLFLGDDWSNYAVFSDGYDSSLFGPPIYDMLQKFLGQSTV